MGLTIALAAAAAVSSLNQATTEPDAERLKLNGSLRVRYELIDGQARAGFNSSDDLLNFRTTLLAEYDASPVRVVAELYDSRAYGADRGSPISTNEVNALELAQAYVAGSITDPIGRGTSLNAQAGRFLLNLGSRRLVAADDYRNTTSSYTGVRADLAGPDGAKATLIYTLPQMRQPDDLESVLDNDVAIDRESFNLVLWGGLVSKTKLLGPATLEVSYFHLGEDDAPGRPTRNRSLETVSARVIKDPAMAKFDYEVEGIYQFGTIAASLAPAAPLLDVGAWFVHAEAGYSLARSWKPRISVEFDVASGDRPGGRYGRFDTLFGMRRADLAPAGLYNAVGRANIATPGLRIEATPNAKIDWFVGYRPMWLASRTDSFSTTGVRDATGRSGDFAGHQIDARLRYLAAKWLRLEVDAVLLAKGRFLRDAPNAPPGSTTKYLSLNATATF